MSDVLRLEGVGKTYAKDGPAPVTVLDGLDLVLEQGSVVALMGANGAGKSTLLDLVCGLTEPNQGTLQVMGQRPRVAVRRGRVGAMLQSGGLLADLTVAETAELFVWLHGNQVDAAELLERLESDRALLRSNARAYRAFVREAYTQEAYTRRMDALLGTLFAADGR